MSYEPQQPDRQQPAVENYPEAINGVVEAGYYPYNQAPQHNQNPQYPPPGDWGQLEVVPLPSVQGSANENLPENTVFGLKKRNFWLLLLLVIVIVIAAVGGGVGGALASKKKATAAVATATVTSTVVNTGGTSSSSSHNTATDPNSTPTDPSSTIAATPTTTGGLENDKQIIKTGMTASQYAGELKKWGGSNYQLTVVSGYSLGTEDGYTAIWEQKDGPAFSTINGLDPIEYQSEYDNRTDQGYYPVLVDGWTVDGADHYAAIWRDSEGKAFPNYVSRHSLNDTAFKTESDKWTKQGYCIKVLSGYTVGTEVRYAAIWNECSTANATVFKYAMSPGQYQTQIETLSTQGYRVSYVSGYAVNDSAYYNGIFTLGSATDCVQACGLNFAGFQRKLEDMNGEGYNLSSVSTFGIGNDNLYAAIWDK